jgi:hypothetical protein
MVNILKVPKINKDTTILSFDLETNGLHGEAFAVGAVVMNADGEVIDEFTGRTKLIGKVDEWVEKNVLPVITDIPETHSSDKHLRDNFWSWFVKAQENSDYVLVSNGYPVEYRFLIQCQEDDLEKRYWDHPFPILDLTSILVAKGVASKEAKIKVMSSKKPKVAGAPHHPVYDAKVACLTAFSVLT